MSNENYLAHYGVKGMKWGIRKARTVASRVRKAAVANPKKAALIGAGGAAGIAGGVVGGRYAAKNRRAEKNRQSRIRRMSDRELKRKIERIELENKYDRLSKKQASTIRKASGDFLAKNFDRIAGGVTTVIGAEAVRRILREPATKTGAKQASKAATAATAAKARKMAKQSKKVYRVVRSL